MKANEDKKSEKTNTRCLIWLGFGLQAKLAALLNRSTR